MNKIKEIWKVLENVKDPEIPAVSVVDLGIITSVETSDDNAFVVMTPTFVGCPAITIMKMQIQKQIEKLGLFNQVEVKIDFETPWTSNRISDEGKRKLKEFGLAPPPNFEGTLTMEELAKVSCPFCGSANTTLNSPFGSTLCRAIHFCYDCDQGFEQFKPI
ncbi:MAG: phenylacetate-CoA oxygenase subunit PaaJ [Chitinophagales bacterium]|nr:phenylacetate-CoA oxygenase subunit PaaJ [Chitinophagales bacterium]